MIVGIRSRRIAWLPALILSVVTAGRLAAADASESFVRLSHSNGGELIALETSVPRFEGKSGNRVTVDLVSAVHVGSKSYYEELNKRFRNYDSVLFELVAPEGFTFPEVKKQEPDSPIPAIQKMLTQALGLSFQLEEIDYRAANFVHADFTVEEFSHSMKEKGETLFSIIMRVFAASLQAEKSTERQTNEMGILFTLLQNPSKERELKLRRLVAREIMQTEDLIQSINGPEGSTLITGRNDKALAVLRKEMEKGKTKFAIFYGGGHMSDMAAKLEKKFGMKRVSTEWLEAWNLRMPQPAEPAAAN